jgi:predicted nucleic acid-binding protein
MRKKKPIVYYWDSCCFIDLLSRTLGRIEDLETIRDAAEKGQARLVTSSFTLAEVIKTCGEGQPELSKDDEELITDLFTEPYVKVRAVDVEVARIAREVHRIGNTKPADSVHIATALLMKAHELHTYDDKDMRNRDGVIPRIGRDGKLSGPPLRIVEPRFEQLAFQTEEDAEQEPSDGIEGQ